MVRKEKVNKLGGMTLDSLHVHHRSFIISYELDNINW
jgi:hypothetical protein